MMSNLSETQTCLSDTDQLAEPEALPGILGGFTITVVALIGSSAMAGAVGAGGLGDLAIRYGYQRFDTTVMISVIALLIVLVSTVQLSGDWLVRRLLAKM